MKIECKAIKCEANINGYCGRGIITINVDKTCQDFKLLVTRN
jgi:hypothetical protein